MLINLYTYFFASQIRTIFARSYLKDNEKTKDRFQSLGYRETEKGTGAGRGRNRNRGVEK